jgi:hypothetical protein
MSPQDETRPMTETSAAASNDDANQTLVDTGKKPFLEPTISLSLNILDSTAFFQGSVPNVDSGDV